MDRLVAVGAAALLLAVVLPADAYHIRDNPASAWDGFEPLEWTGPVQLGILACEENPSSPSNPGRSGVGGLCYMSTGFSGTPCAAAGVSNGFYSDYTGGPCLPASTPPPALSPPLVAHWQMIAMVIPGVGHIDFMAEIGGLGCGVSGWSLVYDEQFAYTVSSGHVTGVPAAPPAPGTFGTYWVWPGSPTGMTQCGSNPLYI